MRNAHQIYELDDCEAGTRLPATLTLDENGLIRDCCKVGEQLFGYHRGELLMQHASTLFPLLSGIPLLHKGVFNPRLDFLCHCGHRFVAQNKEGCSFNSLLHFVYLQYGDRTIIRLIVRPSAEERVKMGRMPMLESIVNAS